VYVDVVDVKCVSGVMIESGQGQRSEAKVKASLFEARATIFLSLSCFPVTFGFI